MRNLADKEKISVDMLKAHILQKVNANNNMRTVEIQKWVHDQHKISHRHTLRILDEMKKNHQLEKKKIPGIGKHERWTIAESEIAHDADNHNFYVIGTDKNKKEKRTFMYQTDVKDLIKKWKTQIDNAKKSKDTGEILNVCFYTIMAAHHWHKMETFGIYSGWLGTTEAHNKQAESIRDEIQEFMKNVFKTVKSINNEQYFHNFLHSVHDVLTTQTSVPQRSWKYLIY